jgi:broad-specificity NMP kinase
MQSLRHVLWIGGSPGSGKTTVATRIARRHGLRAAVERLFEDALDAGPLAETVAERSRLLREGNEAIVAQVRAYYARPWAEGEADQVVRSFVCECGERSCEASVEVAVGVPAAAPVLAAGHG